ncbi:hypothetical protein M408DRAFT_138703 [Serendipita vermifera MAFF 305830]|uniref:Uncharacterized protein n=1 Tax=Serendipita vermifera MAFF 305830 TaxID=933852 RepID=A0A0C2W1H2_SERVB|nr:hypothetical protein M408DRAFT_138703 [Serendipita vermifera MAFF 305830]
MNKTSAASESKNVSSSDSFVKLSRPPTSSLSWAQIIRCATRVSILIRQRPSAPRKPLPNPIDSNPDLKTNNKPRNPVKWSYDADSPDHQKPRFRENMISSSPIIQRFGIHQCRLRNSKPTAWASMITPSTTSQVLLLRIYPKPRMNH